MNCTSYPCSENKSADQLRSWSAPLFSHIFSHDVAHYTRMILVSGMTEKLLTGH